VRIRLGDPPGSGQRGSVAGAAGGGHHRGGERVPHGVSPHYDLYATAAFATAVNHRVTLLHLFYVRLRHGAAGLAGFEDRLRPLNVAGTDDLDTLA
jgi:hypothetical protein